MTKISLLPAASAPTGAETLPIVQDGQTRRATLGDLVAPTLAAAEGYASEAALQLGLVNAAGDGQVAIVNTAGAGQVAAVNAAGAAQVAAVNAAGAASVGSAASSATAAAAATGTVRKALILDIDPSFMIGQSRTIYNDAGRFRRNANGWYRSTSANEERTYYDSTGTLQGILFEAGESYLSAGWDTATAPTSGQDAYLTKSISTDTIAYATSHAVYDLFGTTGKCVKLTQGTSSTGQIYASNLQAALVSGDIVRYEAFVTVVNGQGTAGSFSAGLRAISGSVPSGLITVNFDATGAVTTSSASGYRRFDAVLFETLSDGSKVYFIWIEFAATATGVAAPMFRMPNPAINGSIFALHEMRLVKNPVHRVPSAVPVLNRVAFNPDKIVLPTTQPVAVEFWRMRRGATMQANGTITLPTGQTGGATTGYRSGPNWNSNSTIGFYVPVERRINVFPTSEAANKDYILPNSRQSLDIQSVAATDNVTCYLGPGYHYEFPFVTNTTIPNLTIQGAYAAPDMWPTLCGLSTSQSYVTNLTYRNVAFFTRASTKAEEVGQTGLTSICNMNCAGTYTQDRVLMTTHTQAHTRGDGTLFYGEEAGAAQVRYMDYYAPLPRALSGSGPNILSVTNSIYWRIGRGYIHGSYPQTYGVTITLSACHSEEIYSDAVYWSSGDLTATWDRCWHGRFTDWQYDGYFARDQIMVDVGAGLQTLAAAGLTSAGLPRNRTFSLHSMRPGPGQAIDTTQATIAKWATPTRTVRNFGWDIASTESLIATYYNTANIFARFEPVPLRTGGAAYLPQVGPSYGTYALLLAVTDVQDGDWAFVPKWGDSGSHTDPWSGAPAPNYGVFKYIAGYGWVWMCYAWPEQAGSIYTSLTALQTAWATTPPAQYTYAEVQGDGSNDGAYYASDALGTAAYLGPVALPVWASTTGLPSPTNPHIYFTMDHVYRQVTTGNYIGVSGGNPGAVAMGATHADNNQINATSCNLRLTRTNCIQINHAMGDNVPGQINSTVPFLDCHNNIYVMDTYNVLLVQNTSNTDNMTWHDNVVLPLQCRFVQGAAVPYPWLAGITMRNNVATYNNWFCTDTTKPQTSVSGGGGTFTTNPSIIARQTMTNYFYAAAKRSPTVPMRTEDMIVSPALALGATLPDGMKLQDLVFSNMAERVTGIPLNSIVQSVLGILGFDSRVATLKAMLHKEQLKPDYVIQITEATAAGTVLVSGLKGRFWDPKRGGNEDLLFTLINGTVTVATGVSLTGMNFRRLYITDAGERVEIDCRYVLQTLTLSNTAGTHGVAWTANIIGSKAYSYGQGAGVTYASLTATSSDGTTLTIGGTTTRTISGTFPNAGTFAITITENPPASTAFQTEVCSNPGKVTVINVTMA